MTADDALHRRDLASEPLHLDLAAAAEAMPVDLEAPQDRRAATLVRQSGLHCSCCTCGPVRRSPNTPR